MTPIIWAFVVACSILSAGLFIAGALWPRRRTPYTPALPGSRAAAAALRRAREEEWTTGWRAPVYRAAAVLATPFGRPGAHRPGEAGGYYCAGCDHHITHGLAHDCRALAQIRKDATP